MIEKEKMLAGEGYLASDPELVDERRNTRFFLREYNQSLPDEIEKRRKILEGLFGQIGSKIEVEPPFYCDYGYNIKVGENFYCNFNCIILDCAEVKIGKNVMFGPNVQIYTAYHPVNPEERLTGIEMASPITIGDNAWIGWGTIINPGITIGDNSVIGAGSVVVKDIPPNSVAVGNPCKVIRKL